MLKFNTQKIKYFISGVIVSGLLTSTIAFANPIQQFILQKSEYPMLINGNAFKSDSPILNYEGKTYIPLKDVGNLLQCNVKWDSELKRIEISKEVNKEVKSDENKYNENINSNSNHGAGGGGIYSPVNNEKQGIQLQSKQTDNTDNTKPAHGYVLTAVTSGNSGGFYQLTGLNDQLTSLTVGTIYFLSTAGGVTSTPPTTAGNLNQELGIAKTTSALAVYERPTITIG